MLLKGSAMLETRELLSMMAFLGAFLLTGGLGLLLLKFHRDRDRALMRLRELTESGSHARPRNGFTALLANVVPRVGTLILPAEGEARNRLQQRLTRAGLYRSWSLHVFLGVKVLIVIGMPVAVALVPWMLGLLQPRTAAVAALLAALVGLILPGLWLDARTRKHQGALRRGLADALDMLVLCLEGGVSMTSAIQRAAAELQLAHPLLGAEFNIIQREMQMGLSAGDAFKKFADRCDLEPVRDLATVLLQSERFGAGVVKALRLHSDASRLERQQRAEEMAQKASVKILLPTLLCIFPAIFIVILGPAAYQIASMLSQMRK